MGNRLKLSMWHHRLIIMLPQIFPTTAENNGIVYMPNIPFNSHSFDGFKTKKENACVD